MVTALSSRKPILPQETVQKKLFFCGHPFMLKEESSNHDCITYLIKCISKSTYQTFNICTKCNQLISHKSSQKFKLPGYVYFFYNLSTILNPLTAIVTIGIDQQMLFYCVYHYLKLFIQCKFPFASVSNNTQYIALKVNVAVKQKSIHVGNIQ